MGRGLQVGVPKGVDEVGALHEVSLVESVGDGLDGLVHLVQDPELGEGLVAAESGLLRGDKVLDGVKLANDILARVPDLVAEAPVRVDDLDVEVDVAAARGVGDEGEAESVGSAFWNALREGGLLEPGGILDLGGGEVACEKLVVERLELDSVDDIQWVDDISE